MEGRNKANREEQGQRLHRDQLLTVGDFENLKQDLFNEIKKLDRFQFFCFIFIVLYYN